MLSTQPSNLIFEVGLDWDAFLVFFVQECDIKHMGAGGGGANSAAAFIERFIEDGVKWTHFDIAGASGTPGQPLAGNG